MKWNTTIFLMCNIENKNIKDELFLEFIWIINFRPKSISIVFQIKLNNYWKQLIDAILSKMNFHVKNT